MNYTSRFTTLLGECRRQMNGAVAGSMRYYGKEYGLNYGVSLSTVRDLAVAEGRDHAYACYLYQQQVREIRLASFHIAQAERIELSHLPFWAEGIINTEVAEESSFALFQYVDHIATWLDAEDELLQYTALLSIAKGRSCKFGDIENKLVAIMNQNSMLLASAIVILLENYYRDSLNRAAIDRFTTSLKESNCTEYILSEFEWRKECE
ncbi:MAG: DNA alkylation repair enzyme [Rikenellaceae bacterium]